MKAILAVLLVVLAGCAQSSAPEGLPEQAVAPLAIRCPQVSYQPAEACVGVLGKEGDSWGEPYVAAHPDREGLFVIGVQGYGAEEVNPGPIPGSGFLETRTSHCPGFETCLFITEDGGATWTSTEVGDGDLRADPIIGFVDDTMLVAALTNSGGQSAIKVYRSPDLGVTWSGTELGAAPKTDRPWMSVHGDEVMMVWQTAGKAEGWWSLSTDGGASWGPVHELPCNLFGKPQFADGWIAACSNQRGTPVYRLDGSGATLSTVPSSGGTRMLSQGLEGHLWMTVPGGASAYRSDTGGVSWTGPFDILAGVDHTHWNGDWVYWAEAPPTGGLLVLFTGHPDYCVSGCDEGHSMPVYLAHLDHDGTQLWTEHLFGGGPTHPDRPTSPGLERPLGEFGGIACQYEACLVAWMASGGVDYTWIAPI